MGKQAAAIGAELRRQIELIVQAFVLELDKRLRRYTPVDTGHARANWVPSIGDPFTGTIEITGAAAAAIVLTYKLGDGAIWITNNVPYINALNYGHSAQAPAGFIELAIDEAIDAIQQRLNARIVIDPRSTSSKYGADQKAGAMAQNVASAYSPFGDD